MSQNGVFQILFFLIVFIVLAKPLGTYIAKVFSGEALWIDRICAPFERFIYRFSGIEPKTEMTWKKYLVCLLLFNMFAMLAAYTIQRVQAYLPLNPQSFANIRPDLAFNVAASFVTNTDWQPYSGESSFSYLTQMLVCTVQNFLSAATGLALVIALIRGLIRHESKKIGNFWVDIVRGTLYILLPLAMILALLLASQGVIQNYKPYQTFQPLQTTSESVPQVLPMGPVASQVAIKQLGTNGGGFFNTSSAHPYENPTPVTNFLEMVAIILIPAALCFTFGIMVRDKRQGTALLVTMLIMFIPLILVTAVIERHGNPALAQLGVNQTSKYWAVGGNLEGKEVRFGTLNSSLWTITATASSNGAANSMLDSYLPLSGMIPLWLMHTGEVIFGGIGSGLYSMLMLVIMAVFVGGLMVGRSPEYLGKKIEPFEMKMASVAVLLMPLIVAILTAVGVFFGTDSLGNPGPHGFTEMLYAFSSMGNNNGSAFSGLNANTPFYNIVGGLEMLITRYWIAISVLAIAGSLVQKKSIPCSIGTLPTHTLQFVVLLLGVIIIFGALTIFPALFLGPIVEQLMLWGQYGH